MIAFTVFIGIIAIFHYGQAQTIRRNVVGIITVDNGNPNKGEWTINEFCPHDTYATGFSLLVCMHLNVSNTMLLMLYRVDNIRAAEATIGLHCTVLPMNTHEHPDTRRNCNVYSLHRVNSCGARIET